jgi:hypothetical protein
MFVRPPAVRQAALALVAQGLNDCEVARRLGVPRRTVRDWRIRPPATVRALCLRCWRPTSLVLFSAADYAELLGLYLGDGHISQLARTQRLRLFLDARYSTIVADADALIRRCFPDNRNGRLVRHGGSMVVLWVYNSHLACLFPQHGSGKKHERAIILEPWQQAPIEAEPWAFLRGLIRSDGCVFINRTGKYEYLSYCFDNHSANIRRLFVAACSLVGVQCRPAGTSVRIYRRPSVALMLEHVGIKS